MEGVIRKFTSSVASQTYQFARQFYGEEFYWGVGKRRNCELRKKEKTRTGKKIANPGSVQYISIWSLNLRKYENQNRRI